jgi:hypothetical protein
MGAKAPDKPTGNRPTVFPPAPPLPHERTEDYLNRIGGIQPTLMEELLAKSGYKACGKCGAKAHVNDAGACWLCENGG